MFTFALHFIPNRCPTLMLSTHNHTPHFIFGCIGNAATAALRCAPLRSCYYIVIGIPARRCSCNWREALSPLPALLLLPFRELFRFSLRFLSHSSLRYFFRFSFSSSHFPFLFLLFGFQCGLLLSVTGASHTIFIFNSSHGSVAQSSFSVSMRPGQPVRTVFRDFQSMRIIWSRLFSVSRLAGSIRVGCFSRSIYPRRLFIRASHLQGRALRAVKPFLHNSLSTKIARMSLPSHIMRLVAVFATNEAQKQHNCAPKKRPIVKPKNHARVFLVSRPWFFKTTPVVLKFHARSFWKSQASFFKIAKVTHNKHLANGRMSDAERQSADWSAYSGLGCCFSILTFTL